MSSEYYSSIINLVKFILSSLFIYHVVVVLSILSFDTELSLLFRVLYLTSIGLAFYSLFSLFLDERRGIVYSLFCFVMVFFLNISIDFRALYPLLGVVLVIILLLLRILKVKLH
ncbi:hypothetical protein [Palaeococcus sp. (in: euryarchaeotes)]